MFSELVHPGEESSSEGADELVTAAAGRGNVTDRGSGTTVKMTTTGGGGELVTAAAGRGITDIESRGFAKDDAQGDK